MNDLKIDRLHTFKAPKKLKVLRCLSFKDFTLPQYKKSCILIKTKIITKNFLLSQKESRQKGQTLATAKTGGVTKRGIELWA